MKTKTVFVCKECGNESPKWMGKCPGCGTWNSMIEEVIEKTSQAKVRKSVSPVLIKEVSTKEGERSSSGSEELDRVLGGGIVKGSLVLCGGEPGIGKSTLLLQLAKFASEKGTVLYVSGEESDKQIRLRAERLNAVSDSLYVLNETDLEAILSAIDVMKPALIIADSIQTLYSSNLTSAPGSVGQVRECTLKFMELAKSTGTTVFIVGHVTK